MQLARYLEGGPLMWMVPLHLHINQKSDYDDAGQQMILAGKELTYWVQINSPTNKEK